MGGWLCSCKNDLSELENEVQGMIKNVELMKNPQLASILLRKVIEYMYCKIKITESTELFEKIKAFQYQYAQCLKKKDASKDPTQWFKIYYQVMTKLYDQIDKTRLDVHDDLKKLNKILKQIEPQVNSLKDNNSKKQSENFEHLDQKIKSKQNKSGLQGEQQKKKTEKQPIQEKPEKIGKKKSKQLEHLDSLESPLRAHSESYCQMSQYRYSSGLKKQLDTEVKEYNSELDWTKMKLETEYQKNNDLRKTIKQLEDSLKSSTQTIKKIEKQLKEESSLADSLRKEQQKLKEVYDQEKEAFEKEKKQLKLENKKHVDTFLTQYTINRSSVYSETLVQEGSESFALEIPRPNLKVISNVIKEDFKVLTQIKQKRKHKDSVTSTNETAMITQYQIMVKYFSQSQVLPSFHTLEEAVKMRKAIISMFQSKISETKLLFAFDPINVLNFNDYIEKKQNLLVLALLENGTIIGGFTGELNKEGYVTHSFLFSLKQGREAFKLETLDNVNKINSDPTYINFGNSELKIRGNNLNFVCNINGFQCHYFMKEKRMSVESFLGGGNREQIVKTYEIHQVCFA